MTPLNTALSPKDAELELAINNINPDTLRSVLKTICQESPEVSYKVAQKLLVSEDQVVSVHDGKDASASSTASNDKKRPAESDPDAQKLRPRYAQCENCEREFDVTMNSATACRFHSSGYEPIWEAFADHEEECHGPIDCDWIREEWPEHFEFYCCERTLKDEPCCVDWHREVPASSKKARLS